MLKEEKNGQVQGGVARIPVDLSSSAMRARINPRDGQLYASGLKGWRDQCKGNGGLDRIRYTGKPVYLPKSIQVKKDRIEIGFYQSLDREMANSLAQYKLGAWNVKWSFNYGSPEIPVDGLELKKVELLDDGKTVALHIPNLKPVHMMQIDYDLQVCRWSFHEGKNRQYHPYCRMRNHAQQAFVTLLFHGTHRNLST